MERRGNKAENRRPATKADKRFPFFGIHLEPDVKEPGVVPAILASLLGAVCAGAMNAGIQVPICDYRPRFVRKNYTSPGKPKGWSNEPLIKEC